MGTLRSNFGGSFYIIDSNQVMGRAALFTLLIISFISLALSESKVSPNLPIIYEPEEINQAERINLEVEKKSAGLENGYDPIRGLLTDNYFDRDDDLEEEKRQALRYSFGLGKRQNNLIPNRFAFGLGKRLSFQRSSDPNKISHWQTTRKERDSADDYMKRRFNFGLGKRGARYYAFGLGR